MKNFKLKYVALVLVLGLLNSCATEDAIQVDEKEAAVNKDFVFEPNIDSYVIDGIETTDRTSISDAATVAWNIHHDYPNRKVVISTNVTEFDKYLNSDLELKARLIESNNESPKRPTLATEAAVTFNQYDAINYPNHLVFFVHLASSKQCVIFPVVRNNDLSIGFNAHYCRENQTTVFSTFNVVGSWMFRPQADRPNDDTWLRNTSGVTKSITFYTGKNLTGTSSILSVGKLNKVKISNRSSAQSFK